MCSCVLNVYDFLKYTLTTQNVIINASDQNNIPVNTGSIVVYLDDQQNSRFLSELLWNISTYSTLMFTHCYRSKYCVIKAKQSTKLEGTNFFFRYTVCMLYVVRTYRT
jgi:hypothetical protein